MNNRFVDLIQRRPWQVALVSGLMGLIVVDGSRSTGAGEVEQPWGTWVAVTIATWATVMFAVSFTSPRLAGSQPELLRWALAWAPVTGAVLVPLTGGPIWISWAGLGISWVLFTTLAVTTSAAGQSSPE